jgi:hypothetical protein
MQVARTILQRRDAGSNGDNPALHPDLLLKQFMDAKALLFCLVLVMQLAKLLARVICPAILCGLPRATQCQCFRGHIRCDDGACSNYGLLSDRHWRDERGVGPNECSICNGCPVLGHAICMRRMDPFACKSTDFLQDDILGSGHMRLSVS